MEGSVFILTKSGSPVKLPLVVLSLIPAAGLDEFSQRHRDSFHEVLLRAYSEKKRLENERIKMLQELEDYTIGFQRTAHETAWKIRSEEETLMLQSGKTLEEISRDRDQWAQKWERDRKELRKKLDTSREAGEKERAAVAMQCVDREQIPLIVLGDVIETNLFAALPSSVVTTYSDEEGKFSIALPAAGNFILVAKAQRQVGQRKEYYHWLIKVDRDKLNARLSLSNHNLLLTKNSQSVSDIVPFSRMQN